MEKRKQKQKKKKIDSNGDEKKDAAMNGSEVNPSDSEVAANDSLVSRSSNSNSEDEAQGAANKRVKLDKQKRIFQARDSILTYALCMSGGCTLLTLFGVFSLFNHFRRELCTKDKNIEALYHVLMIMTVTTILYSLLRDSVEAGMPHVDFTLYVNGFGSGSKQLMAIGMWFCLQTAVLLVYPAFMLWQKMRAVSPTCADAFFATLFLLYQMAAHTAVVTFIVQLNLPPVPSLCLSIEQLRFTMKSYSFVRENAYKVLHPWNKDDSTGPAIWYAGQMEPKVGSIASYLYFLFVPTLLYRDRYPRTPRVQYLRVFSHFIKCAVSITFMVILCKEVFNPSNHGRYGNAVPFSAKFVANQFLACMLWGLCLQFMTGYFFLHSWSNMFAEMLRFADREFYADWWTCTSFSMFYRKWNLLIHDWIKAYIYHDLRDLFNSKFYNRIASFPTIIISALFHEYVLWAPFRFIAPILLVQYGTFGTILYFVKPSPNSKFWNYFIHIGLNIGVAAMVFCYTMELYARHLCPREESFSNTFMPRSLDCVLL